MMQRWSDYLHGLKAAHENSNVVTFARSGSAVVLSVLTAIGLGCVDPGTSVEIGGDLGFNPKLRADLAPLSPDNQKDEQLTFSDGNLATGRNTGLISELVPTEMTSTELRRLRRSDTFWILGGSVDLSYELTVRNPSFNGESLTLSRAPGSFEDSGYPAVVLGWHPGKGFTDPDTRRLALFRGATFSVPYVPQRTQYTMMLRTCQAALVADPNLPPGRLDRSCRDEEVGADLCNTDNLITTSTWFPYTVMRCGIGFNGDASMTLEAVDIASGLNVETSFPSLTHKARPLHPNLRQIATAPGGMRTLARPLRFDVEECIIESVLDIRERSCDDDPAEDPGEGAKYLRSTWSWQVAVDPATRWWNENFSPRLFVARVFLFVQDPDTPGMTGRRYLSPENVERLSIAHPPSPGLSESAEIECSPTDVETGRAVFDLADCNVNAVVTPTYDHTRLESEVTVPLGWTPRFRVTATGASFPDDLPVAREKDLFIEFEVMSLNTAQSSSGLTASLAAFDFGAITRGVKESRERAIRITNHGTFTETLAELRLEGRNAGEFSVIPTDGHSLPHNLAPGKYIDLTMGVRAQGSGWREADLIWSARVAGATVERYVALRSTTVYSDAKLQPTTLGFDAPRGSGLNNAQQRARRFLIESVGAQELQVFSVRVEGPDARHFSVLESTERDLSSDIFGMPYPAPTWIVSGDADLLTVIYHPSVPTTSDVHRATVVVEHDAGTSELDVVGGCWNAPRDCDYDPPPALAGP